MALWRPESSAEGKLLLRSSPGRIWRNCSYSTRTAIQTEEIYEAIADITAQARRRDCAARSRRVYWGSRAGVQVICGRTDIAAGRAGRPRPRWRVPHQSRGIETRQDILRREGEWKLL